MILVIDTNGVNLLYKIFNYSNIVLAIGYILMYQDTYFNFFVAKVEVDQVKP